MQKKIVVETSLAPAAVGTYSQGIVHNGVAYFSGQIGLDPQTQTLAVGFANQLQQIMKNIDGLLESQQMARENIIKTTIFLVDLKNFSEINIAYQDFFTAPYPARSTVEVSGLPKGALVEIEVLAAK
jgi:2-iminobutanoate/2-iminopropanoate deaminase